MAERLGALLRVVGLALGWVVKATPGILGPGLITAGALMVYRPAGFIVAGLFLLAIDWRLR